MPRQVAWEDLSPRQRAGLMIGMSVQISLAVTAWVDLARRPVEQVRGRKIMWVPVIALNGVGPVAYFLAGIRR
jgi:hypothetical protein